MTPRTRGQKRSNEATNEHAKRRKTNDIAASQDQEPKSVEDQQEEKTNKNSSEETRSLELDHPNRVGKLTEAQRQRNIQRDALDRFKAMYDAAAEHYNPLDEIVSTGELLEQGTVVTAIMAVTEAIKWRLVPGDQASDTVNSFDIISDVRVDMAKKDPSELSEADRVRCVRPGRPLFIPWIFNEHEQRAISGLSELTEQELGQAAADSDKRHGSHTFLLLIRMDRGLCEIRIYDSYRLRFRDDPEMWPHVLRSIHQVVRNIGWLPGEQVTRDEGDRNLCFGPEADIRVAHQGGGEHSPWACGFHTILNAWTVAMNLLPNPNFSPPTANPLSFYETAAQVINYAAAGLANSNLIYAFLVGFGFAMPSKLPKQCPSFPELRVVHDIRNSGSLASYVNLKEVEEATRPPRQLPQFPPGVPMLSPVRPRYTAPAATPRMRADMQQSDPSLIEPAVMANELFLNADCMSVWQQLNSTKGGKGLIAHNRIASRASILNFIEYYNWKLGGEATQDLSYDQKIEWFHTQRRKFDIALHFPAEAVQPQTEESLALVRLQFECLRHLAQRKIVPLKARFQLGQLYRRCMESLEIGRNAEMRSPTIGPRRSPRSPRSPDRGRQNPKTNTDDDGDEVQDADDELRDEDEGVGNDEDDPSASEWEGE